jgi:hypothetical protein
MDKKKKDPKRIRTKPKDIIHWFVNLINKPAVHKEVRMKRKGAIQWFMKLVILGLFFSCKSPESRTPVAVHASEKDLQMVQKEDSAVYFKELQEFRKRAKVELNKKEAALESMESVQPEQGNVLKPERRKAIIDVQHKIALLLKKLDVYNEEGEANAKMFMTGFQKEMDDLDQSIGSLQK